MSADIIELVRRSSQKPASWSGSISQVKSHPERMACASRENAPPGTNIELRKLWS
jgi:hypothetical protein